MLLKIFISYANDDHELAGEIKRLLEDRYGVDVFLAHDDIRPSREWQEEIKEALNETNAFLALLTESFDGSDYTDQETGYALARDIPIIPLNAGNIPHGFISRYQALRINRRSIESSCDSIAQTLSTIRQIRGMFLDSLIRRFGNSYSFDEAAVMTNRLLEFEGYSRQQKNEIVRLAAANDQISKSFKAQRKLGTFIKTNADELDQDLVETYQEKSST